MMTVGELNRYIKHYIEEDKTHCYNVDRRMGIGKVILCRKDTQIKEGETRRFSPGSGLRRFPQYNHGV